MGMYIEWFKTTDGRNTPIAPTEVQKAVSSLSNNKTPVLIEIHVELLSQPPIR